MILRAFSKTLVALIMFAILSMLGGCNSDTSDLKDYVAKIKARKSSDIEPIPAIKPYHPFTYRGDDLRDPFLPPAAADSGPRHSTSSVVPNRSRNKEPLEEFPLDALRMAGTLSIGGVKSALIKAPDGIVHRVTRGDHMGQNFGQIVAINETDVQLIEIVPDGLGGYMKRAASLALSK